MAAVTIAFGGGKGGTGKSCLAVQLGVLLAQEGLRVALVDADPNGANLHSFFGLEDPSTNIDVLLAQSVPPREVMLPTGIRDLGLVPGTRQELRPRHDPSLLADAVSRLHQLDADVLLLDVGSGTSMWSTYLFEQASLGCWVVQPEPTCVEREYHFLRHVCRWRIASSLEGLEPPPAGWLPVPWLSSVKRADPERARTLHEQLRAKPFLLIGNQVRQPEERALPAEMMAACRRFFGLDGESLGWLSFDERVWLSVRQRRPVVLEYPESRWAAQCREVLHRLLPFVSMHGESDVR